MPDSLRGTINCAANTLLPGWESPDTWAEYSSWGGASSLREEKVALYVELLDPQTWTKVCLEASVEIDESVMHSDDFISGRRVVWPELARILSVPLTKSIMKKWTKMGTAKEVETAEEIFIYSLFTLNVWQMEGCIRKQIQQDRRNTPHISLIKYELFELC